MDLATIIGLIMAIGAVLGGQILEGGSIKSIMQPTAAIIVLGGTFGACMVQFPMRVVITSFLSITKAFLEPKIHTREIIAEIVRFANKARKEGIISLEHELEKASDPFLRKALNMAVDGVEPKILRDTMEMEMSNMEDEAEHPIKFWEAAGGYSPTIGIIGAVLGLIHVMENLSDPSKLGGGIAVAFVATVYGVGLANLVYLPISGKLKMKSKAQMVAWQVMFIGVISILEGENPRLIEDKLKSFLSQKEQDESAGDQAAQRKAA
jgi:chemotaxis protein MotA